MRIVCPECLAPIAGQDVDLPAGRALCRPCGELVLLPGPRSLVRASPPLPGPGSDDLPPVLVDPLDGAPERPRQPSTPPEEATRLQGGPGAALAVTSARPLELALLEEQRGGGVELSSTAGTPIAGLTAVTVTATMTLLLALLGSALLAGVSLELALVGVAALILPGVPLLRLFRGGRRHYLRLDEGGLSHLPYRHGEEIHEPLERIRHFVVDLTVDPARLGELPAIVTEWPVRMLTVDGRAVELRLGLRSEEQVRYVAARLNRALEALRSPLGYRG